jgi:UDP-glucose 4-epimerase
MGENFIITGGGGFVGSYLGKSLASQGKVLLVDREIDLGDGDGCERMASDIQEAIPEREGYEKPVVIHAAAIMNSKDLGEYWRVNVQGTKNVLDWTVRKRAKRFIYISTGGVYGYNRNKRMKERDALNPIGPYGFTKWIGENTCLMFSRIHGLIVTVIRLYFPYGPGQKRGMFPLIRESILTGARLTIKKGGSPQVNPVHIHDLIEAIKKALQCDEMFKIYNVCGDETTNFRELTQRFERELGRRANVMQTEQDEGDLLGDNALIKQELGWEPKVKLQGGIREVACKLC